MARQIFEYSEPFRSQFERALNAADTLRHQREQDEKDAAAFKAVKPRYGSPMDKRAASVPLTAKQKWKLKDLGYEGPFEITKFEASALISRLGEKR